MFSLKRLALLFAACAILVGSGYLWTRPQTLRIAVGPADTEQARFVERLAANLATSTEPFRLTVVPANGTEEASTVLDAGQADLAVLRSDDLISREARAVAILQRRVVIILARADRAKTLPELRERRVLLVRGQGDPNSRLATRLLAHFDLATEDKPLAEFSLNEATERFARDDADALIFIAPVAGRNIRELAQQMAKAGVALQVIELPGAKGLVTRFPYLEAATIPVGVLGGAPSLPTEEIETVSITYELVAGRKLNEITVSALTKTLLGIRLRNTATAGSQFAIEAPPTDDPRRFLPHPGTAAFLNNETKTLLETYSDHIWLALFLISILGSSVTGLLVWIGLRKPADSEDAFAKLPALIERIRTARSLSEIDAVQAAFDEIASISVLDYARGQLAEDDLDRAAWLAQVQSLIDRQRARIAPQSS